MSKYGEPWIEDSRFFSGGIRDVPRAIACVNACAGIEHPEMLPELVEAVRNVDHRIYRSKEIDQEADFEAIYAVLRAFSAVMGESA